MTACMRLLALAALLALCAPAANGAALTPTEQMRDISAAVDVSVCDGEGNCDGPFDVDGDEVFDFGPFDSEVGVEIGTPDGGPFIAWAAAGASQTSQIGVASMAAAGEVSGSARTVPPDGDGENFADYFGESLFSVWFTVDEDSSWRLTGSLAGDPVGDPVHVEFNIRNDFGGGDILWWFDPTDGTLFDETFDLSASEEYRVFAVAKAEGDGYDGFDTEQSASFNLAFELVAGPALLGDANLDGVVDDDDLSLLLANWNQNVTGDPDGGWGRGEFNATPPVNDDDLSLILANWTAGSEVPEPASAMILLLGAWAVARRRR